MIQDMKPVIVPIKEILPDFFFRFGAVRDTAPLVRSIKTSGILKPLLAHRTGTGYRLISGFRRYEAAVSLRINDVPVNLLPPRTSLTEGFRHALLEQYSDRVPALMEKARVLSILKKLKTNRSVKEKDFFPILEISPYSGSEDEILSLLTLSPRVREYIENYGLSLKQTRVFRFLGTRDQKRVIDLASRYNMRGVELADMVQVMVELAGRERKTVSRIVNELETAGTGGADLTRVQKLFHLKKLLESRRFPGLHERNSRLVGLGKELHLPDSCSVSWDTSFERPGMNLTFWIKTISDMETMDLLFRDGKRKRTLEQMLELLL